MSEAIQIIGAGLAGSEAAWQLAKRGIAVRLYEMRPETQTAVHQTGDFAELVCSNSLGAEGLETGAGLLKAEMRLLDSLVIKAADATRVSAGKALAVDRKRFAEYITAKLSAHPKITVIRQEVTSLRELSGLVLIATGPLTSPGLAEAIQDLTGEADLYFFDAAAPIVERESLDESVMYWKSRYDDEGPGDYLNVPLNREEYEAFWRELTTAEVVPLAEHDKLILFEGCMPIEELARRGLDTLRFGPLRPVGLEINGHRPWAVLQLRKEDEAGRLLNLVGCQTRLKWGEQKRVFRTLPGFAEAEFVRYGVMHRNTYINSPQLLAEDMSLVSHPEIFFAGQITGVEGYLESAASGLYTALMLARRFAGLPPLIWPAETMLGSLMAYITDRRHTDFQPMNANFGLLPDLPEKIRSKKERKLAKARRSLAVLEHFAKTQNI